MGLTIAWKECLPTLPLTRMQPIINIHLETFYPTIFILVFLFRHILSPHLTLHDHQEYPKCDGNIISVAEREVEMPLLFLT